MTTIIMGNYFSYCITRAKLWAFMQVMKVLSHLSVGKESGFPAFLTCRQVVKVTFLTSRQVVAAIHFFGLLAIFTATIVIYPK